MMVNGKPKLGCKTFLRDYISEGKIRLEPLANFPIERDLVVDMSISCRNWKKLNLTSSRKKKNLCDGEYIQTPKQLAQYKQFSQCINCGLCYAACPQYALKPEFLGPAAIALLYRYNEDSRDGAKEERMKLIHQEAGVWSCTFVGFCSEVCPKGVDPAAAIQLYKAESAKIMSSLYVQTGGLIMDISQSKRKPYVRQVKRAGVYATVSIPVYMLREGTCIFVGAYAVILLCGLLRLSPRPRGICWLVDCVTQPIGDFVSSARPGCMSVSCQNLVLSGTESNSYL